MKINGVLFYGVSLAVAVAIAAGCGGNGGEEEPGVPAGGELVRSDQQRILSPQVDDQDYAEQIAGNSDFALRLYNEVYLDDEENLFFSPHSITSALAMSYAGARGTTAEQMAEALGFRLPDAQLHEALNRLDLELHGQADAEEKITLNIANALWAQQGVNFFDEFLDTLALNYDAGVRLMDFKEDPQGSREEINDWVEYKTEGIIRDLIPPPAITKDTTFVLTNAIYFLADWARPFRKESTRDRTFTTFGGGEVSVPMMAQDANFPYFAGEGFEALELPYKGEGFSMVVLLPAEGAFRDFEGELSAELLADIREGLSEEFVRVMLPKFRFEFTVSLVEPLRNLGMPVAFAPLQADFSGITEDIPIFISGVLHKAFVAVDEKGTEAAAATAVIGDGATAVPDEPEIVFQADRPFLFYIVERESGAILFFGRLMDPS